MNRKVFLFFYILGILSMVGCSLTGRMPFPKTVILDRPAVEKAPKTDQRKYYITLDTDPSGAQVLQKTPQGLQVVGVTPLRITIAFVKKPVSGIQGHLGFREWRPLPESKAPYVIECQPQHFVIRLTNICFRKEGFEDQWFAAERKVPVRFTERVRQLKWQDIPMEWTKTVTLQTPTQPQFGRTITVACQTTETQLFSLTSEGGIGRAIGILPKTFRFGFAPKKNDAGGIVGWKWWVDHDADLWVLDQKGILYLNACLMKEGYAPETLLNYPITRIDSSQGMPITVNFRLTKPTSPQKEIVLQIDTLPSQADVFLLRQDGLLGQRITSTPFQINVGLGQQLRRIENTYEHDRWVVWAPSSLLQLEQRPDGTANVILMAAFFREGYAVETVRQIVFQLRPGEPFPDNTALTIPLLRPEQAAARDARTKASEPEWPNKIILWGGEDSIIPPAGTSPLPPFSNEDELTKKSQSTYRPWWNRLRFWQRFHSSSEQNSSASYEGQD